MASGEDGSHEHRHRLRNRKIGCQWSVRFAVRFQTRTAPEQTRVAAAAPTDAACSQPSQCQRDVSSDKKNAKLIIYHGWNDGGNAGAISPLNSIQYYSSILERMGPDQSHWLRLFMMPGVSHCGLGPGPNQVDFIAALERWRESGLAPASVLATRGPAAPKYSRVHDAAALPIPAGRRVLRRRQHERRRQLHVRGVLRVAGIGLIALLLAAINIAGVKGAVRTLSLFTIVKFAPLIVLAVWGLWAFAPHIPAPQAPADPGAVGQISLLLLYAFVGFEMATLTSGETRNSKRVMPFALVGTIAAMTCIYVLVQLSYVAIMQGRTPDAAPLASAAAILAGPWAALAMAAAAMISIGGNMFALFIVTPRITFAMAEEGSLPKWFGEVNRRFFTPANSIVVFAILVSALAMSSAFVWLAVMASLARMFVYLACVAALVKVRRDRPERPRTFAATAVRQIAPLLAGALCVYAISQATPDAWLFPVAFDRSIAAGRAVFTSTAAVPLADQPPALALEHEDKKIRDLPAPRAGTMLQAGAAPGSAFVSEVFVYV